MPKGNNLDQDQTKKELDEEYREVTGDEPAPSTDDEGSKKEKEEEPEGGKPEESKEPKGEPEGKPKSEPEDKPEGEKEKSEESPEGTEPEKSKDPKEPSEGEGEGVESPKRPKKYIPIPQHQDEKKKWRDKEENLNNEIDRLQEQLKMKGGEKEESEQLESEEDIGKFAEDHNMDKDTVQDLVGLISKRNKLPDEVKEDLSKVKEEREEREAQANFEEEFEKDVLPIIKKQYPNASQKSIGQVKEDLESLAHTKRLHQTPLDHIFTHEQSKYGEFLNPPKKKTAETGSMGRKEEGMSYADIYTMPPEERAKYIENFSEDEYEKFMEYAAEQEGSGSTIHREGEEVEKL